MHISKFKYAFKVCTVGTNASHSTQTKSACVLHLSRFRSCWIQQNVCMASFGMTLNSEHWTANTHTHTLNERWNMLKLTLNTYHVVKDNRMNVVRFQDNLFTVSNYEINKLTCFPIWKGTTVSIMTHTDVYSFDF